ncbi:hypothetical protein [Rahnella inusitata]|uniref:hypothetical protein n=1 Tax=Rahnella inusitata TaxID=58169 RepID=UPI0039AEA521
MAPNEWFETLGSKPEIRESRSDDILRHSLMHRKMSVVPVITRSEKAKGDPRGKKHFSLLVGFGAKGRVITDIEKPKLFRTSPSLQAREQLKF